MWAFGFAADGSRYVFACVMSSVGNACVFIYIYVHIHNCCTQALFRAYMYVYIHTHTHMSLVLFGGFF